MIQASKMILKKILKDLEDIMKIKNSGNTLQKIGEITVFVVSSLRLGLRLVLGLELELELGSGC
jgi:hypothetical protein